MPIRSGPCPTLETERLILRPFRDEDVDDYFGVLDTSEVRRWLHLPAGLNRSNAWQQMAVFLGEWALRGTGQWALEERSSGAFLGRAGLYRPEYPDWPGVEVGWTLHPDHWGRGYATEAGAEAIWIGSTPASFPRTRPRRPWPSGSAWSCWRSAPWTSFRPRHTASGHGPGSNP